MLDAGRKRSAAAPAEADLELRLARDHRTADLSSADREMLDYAVKLTEAPAEVGPADVDRLRRQGFGDRAIHDICSIAAYFAFVNRIADGLGVELEEEKP